MTPDEAGKAEGVDSADEVGELMPVVGERVCQPHVACLRHSLTKPSARCSAVALAFQGAGSLFQ